MGDGEGRTPGSARTAILVSAWAEGGREPPLPGARRPRAHKGLHGGWAPPPLRPRHLPLDCWVAQAQPDPGRLFIQPEGWEEGREVAERPRSRVGTGFPTTWTQSRAPELMGG